MSVAASSLLSSTSASLQDFVFAAQVRLGTYKQESTAPPGAQSVPALLRRRGLATRGGALRADGVGFAAEWREAFRLNVGAPEAQALVVSLYAKQLLKVRLMCLC